MRTSRKNDWVIPPKIVKKLRRPYDEGILLCIPVEGKREIRLAPWQPDGKGFNASNARPVFLSEGESPSIPPDVMRHLGVSNSHSSSQLSFEICRGFVAVKRTGTDPQQQYERDTRTD